MIFCTVDLTGAGVGVVFRCVAVFRAGAVGTGGVETGAGEVQRGAAGTGGGV